MNNNPRVVIFSLIQSPRLKYVLEIIFRQRFKINYLITANKNDIQESDVVIEYNLHQETDYDFIQAHKIIQEESVDKKFKPTIEGEETSLRLFPTEDSIFKMDIFSAIFYCLSMYDAYTSNNYDQHKRIVFKEWFPRISGLDQLPYVDIWINKLQLYLDEKGLVCHQSQFEQDISFDIDHFYLLDQRPLFQHIKASIKELLKLRFFQLFQRWMVILGLTQDPAEKFFDFLEYQDKNKFKFFILMKHGKNNSLNPLNDLKKSLIKKLVSHGNIAIHPSYDSYSKTELIEIEKNKLSQIIQYFINTSRFHFLRINFPDSFYALEKYNIKIDQSVGYYDKPGFMASTCQPFNYFNPINNESLNLIIDPFVWMDSMNKYYRDIDDKEEKLELLHFKSIVKKYNGKFNVVFHNDSMVDRRYRMLLKSLLYN